MTESPRFLSEQLITYIGNKRALLGFLGSAVEQVKARLAQPKLRVMDLFSGSGVVSRYFKQHAELLISNDFEPYCEVINSCYLANAAELDLPLLHAVHQELVARLREDALQPGIIAKLYAPQDDTNIQAGERVFYTGRNARYLDTARMLIDGLPQNLQQYFLAPLLAQASVHANTSGVFKGFYKDSATGKGRFGGSNGDALSRITGNISLPFPVYSNFNCRVELRRRDAEQAARDVDQEHGTLDLAYLDPPYNQHPYGSNYFLLNLLVEYQPPQEPSRVSGIPRNWQRSQFNSRPHALGAFRRVTEALNARFLLVSFNSEGHIPLEEMRGYLETLGRVNVLKTRYNAFRGSRNLRSRDIHLTEYLYLVERR